MKTVVQGHKKNFDTLSKAFKAGDVALMECQHRETKEKLAVICAVGREENGDYVFSPFASFFNGNPYELLSPPVPGGGFEETEGA